MNRFHALGIKRVPSKTTRGISTILYSPSVAELCQSEVYSVFTKGASPVVARAIGFKNQTMLQNIRSHVVFVWASNAGFGKTELRVFKGRFVSPGCAATGYIYYALRSA